MVEGHFYRELLINWGIFHSVNCIPFGSHRSNASGGTMQGPAYCCHLEAGQRLSGAVAVVRVDGCLTAIGVRSFGRDRAGRIQSP
jgi:hypothetical protein